MKSRRKNEIMKRLVIEQALKMEEMAAMFGVSVETIRRDVADMERQGLVEKVYGGIRLRQDTGRSRSTLDSWGERMSRCHEEKARIAARALELVEDDSVIALDIGTTVYELSRLLGVKRGLTIITNSLPIAADLARTTGHKVLCIGGQVTTNETVTGGGYARRFLEDLAAVDLFLMGADGVSLRQGVTEYSEGIVDVKRQLAGLARRCVLLCDHSKFGVEAPFKSCPLEQVDTLITDGAAPAKVLDGLRRRGIELLQTE